MRRTEGTYTKYSSIDDKLDTFHQWFALLKFDMEDVPQMQQER